LLYHQSSLLINEHYTDTGGFSDHVFAMCRLLGFRFAPRIREIVSKFFTGFFQQARFAYSTYSPNTQDWLFGPDVALTVDSR
jgi:TnpA family transposase